MMISTRQCSLILNSALFVVSLLPTTSHSDILVITSSIFKRLQLLLLQCQSLSHAPLNAKYFSTGMWIIFVHVMLDVFQYGY
jgi:hypothetical protein